MLNISFSHFPIIRTERLVLRQIGEADAEDVFRLRSDPEAMKYILKPLAESIDDALAYIKRVTDSFANNEGISWAITEKNVGRLVGTIGFWRMDKPNHRAEIGYMLDPALHGKGLMQEAVAPLLDYAFRELRFHTIEGCVDPANQSSIRLLERNGFEREAYFKENYFWNGNFTDTAVYSLITKI